MMSRGLIISLCEAADDWFVYGMRLTPTNFKRQLTKDYLAKYCIKRETKITNHDWMLACKIVREDRTIRFGIKDYLDSPRRSRFERLLRKRIISE